ncbi:hypothetical protein [Nocardioides daphniae]|uniref:Uncharacterized protein n=1 Tax=Nocardioides daphniae TaxID=402297 RepID=A0A4P7UBA8_9ACTN|nr:hypothetical protein [Nocardioides daphniae]QCC76585.1 hypothetical protein E2C04_04010 [Nocardioides daphniae]GGD14324.1 hypothetical protein GCM10007231_11650 [Nocardioides daphniae]
MGRRLLAGFVIVALVVGGVAGGVVALVQGFRGGDEVALSEGFTVDGLTVEDGWWLVASDPSSTPGAPREVLTGVRVRHDGPDSREVRFEMHFHADGQLVTTVSCRAAGEVAPGVEVPATCLGTRLLVPTDFDRVTVRPVG